VCNVLSPTHNTCNYHRQKKEKEKERERERERERGVIDVNEEERGCLWEEE
jgi:hypothetical protein